MIIKRIFVASSSELAEHRREFEIFISRKNKNWVSERKVFLELVIWEDFFDAVSATRLQDEYNAAVRDCDIFVMLYWTKVGAYTREEFEHAHGHFTNHGKPLIFTFFRDEAIDPGGRDPGDFESLWNFQSRLQEIGHFYTRYRTVEELQSRFSAQLDKLAAAGFGDLEGERYEHDAPLARMSRDVASAASAIFRFSQSIHGLNAAGYASHDDDAARRELAALRALTAEGKQLPQSQMAMIADLDEYLESPNRTVADWERIVKGIAETMLRVKSFVEALSLERSDFVLEAAYDQLLQTVHARSRVLVKLVALPPPVTDAECEQVRELSARYKVLLLSFQEGVRALNDYLKPRATAYRQEQERLRNERIDALIAQAIQRQQDTGKS